MDKVGYRKPPKAHQFKKGQSGNPRGRPKKRHDTGNVDLNRILFEEIKVQRGGKPTVMSKMEVGFRQLLKKAAQDNHLPSALRLLNLFLKHKIIKPKNREQGGVVLLPRGMTMAQAILQMEKEQHLSHKQRS